MSLDLITTIVSIFIYVTTLFVSTDVLSVVIALQNAPWSWLLEAYLCI